MHKLFEASELHRGRDLQLGAARETRLAMVATHSWERDWEM
jgi:hypothetical protein